MLEVTDIYTSYGLSQVLFGVSFSVEAGSVVSLVGRNGVGKTTTMRSIAGLQTPHRGSVLWMRQDIIGLSVHQISRLGIAYVPEDRRIFPELTVWENLDIARRKGTNGTGWSEWKVYELFPELAEIPDRAGGVLSGGQQQMLAIGRSLMGNPTLLLLDEPTEGLAPQVVAGLVEQIRKLKEGGMAIVLAEQNLDVVLSLSDQLHVLEKGELKYSGMPDDFRDREDVLEKYLSL